MTKISSRPEDIIIDGFTNAAALLWHAAPWWIWPVLIAAVLLKALTGGKRRRRKKARLSPAQIGAAGEAKVAEQLRRLKIVALHDVYLPSGDDATQIDHIAVMGGVIVSIETKNWSGSIYPGQNGRNWTQSFFGQGSERHLSPIVQNQKHVKAIQEKAGYAAVVGLVVLTGKADFPNGWPDGVIHLDDLALWARTQSATTKGSAATGRAWERLALFHKHCDRPDLMRRHLTAVTTAKARAA